MPQVFPVIAGQMLYFFESNTRSATIIGIVGAGGIGLQLSEQIRVLEWQKVSFLILMILIAVAAIDWISSKLRFAIIGRRAVADFSCSPPRIRCARRQSASGLSAAACRRHRRRRVSTTSTGRPSARSSRAASVASTMAARDPGRCPAVILDAVMRQQLGHRAHRARRRGRRRQSARPTASWCRCRSACGRRSRSVSIRISGAPVFRPSCRASSRVAGSSLAEINWPRGSWPPAPTISENRVRERKRIGEPRRLDIGAAAAFGAHQAAFGQRRQRPAHGVAVDAIGLGDLGFARQLFARGEAGRRRCRARCRRRPDATAPRRKGFPAWSWRGTAGNGHRENHRFVTKQSWRFAIKLSSIIDNLIQARLAQGRHDRS